LFWNIYRKTVYPSCTAFCNLKSMFYVKRTLNVLLKYTKYTYTIICKIILLFGMQILKRRQDCKEVFYSPSKRCWDLEDDITKTLSNHHNKIWVYKVSTILLSEC